MCSFALGNSDTCIELMYKRPFTENKACNICMPKLNMAYVNISVGVIHGQARYNVENFSAQLLSCNMDFNIQQQKPELECSLITHYFLLYKSWD